MYHNMIMVLTVWYNLCLFISQNIPTAPRLEPLVSSLIELELILFGKVCKLIVVTIWFMSQNSSYTLSSTTVSKRNLMHVFACDSTFIALVNIDKRVLVQCRREWKLCYFLFVWKPNLARYQEKQRSLPRSSSAGKSKSPTPPLTSEPDRKKTCRRDVVEPLERTSSPLPILPDDLKTKQEKIDSVAQVNAKSVQRHASPKQTSLSNGTGTMVGKTDVIPEGLRDPLQIIRLIKENSKLGFLYMTPAVDQSSIEYNPYNLK